MNIQEYTDLNVTQQRAMDQYFHEIIFPVLTPMAIDQSRPFPLVHNKSVYLSVMLQKEGEQEGEPFMAIVQVPSNLPRVVQAPIRANSKKKTFILIEDLIKHHIHTLFSGYISLAAQEFRVTRNADLFINEEEAEDLLEAIEKNCAEDAAGLLYDWKCARIFVRMPYWNCRMNLIFTTRYMKLMDHSI